MLIALIVLMFMLLCLVTLKIVEVVRKRIQTHNRNLLKARVFSVFRVSLMLSFGVYLSFSIAEITEIQPPPTSYTAIMGDESRVYDGDTIMDVFVVIKTFENQTYPDQTLWPGVLLKGDKLYAVTDIRIKGIDTPEKRPTKAGRTEESITAEKAAAELARAELSMLLEDNAMEFVVANPSQGKYAGRVIAEVFINGLDVAEYMIEKGLAVPYDGGTKMTWEEMSTFFNEQEW